MTTNNDDLLNAMDQALDDRSLTWAAQWIEDSLKGETNERVIEFGKNMAMTLRAAKGDTHARVRDGVVATVDAERQATAIVTIWRAVKDHDDKLLVHYIKQALLEWCPVAATAPIAALQDKQTK